MAMGIYLPFLECGTDNIACLTSMKEGYSIIRSCFSVFFPFASFIWKAKVPFKLTAFAWSNTNDFRRIGPQSAFQNSYHGHNETHDHLVLHNPIAWRLWCEMFSILLSNVVWPLSNVSFLITGYREALGEASMRIAYTDVGGLGLFGSYRRSGMLSFSVTKHCLLHF